MGLGALGLEVRVGVLGLRVFVVLLNRCLGFRHKPWTTQP